MGGKPDRREYRQSRIKQFESAIRRVQFLVLADVPKKSVTDIEQRIKKHLPQVEIEGTERSYGIP